MLESLLEVMLTKLQLMEVMLTKLQLNMDGYSSFLADLYISRCILMKVKTSTGILSFCMAGIYFGKPRGFGTNDEGEETGFNTEIYSVAEIDRIACVAFEVARKRGGKLCSVDKANVLEASMLWRKRVTAIASEFPDVELSHMYVDNAAMQLVRNPKQFDTIVTNNIFGDILSDEASMIT